MKVDEIGAYNRIADACQNFKQLPHITVFEQESDDKSKKWPSDHIYAGYVSDEHIVAYADKFLLNYFQTLENKRALRQFLEDRKNEQKVIYFGGADDEAEALAPYLKALSAQYRRQLSFGFVEYDNKKLRRDWPQISQSRRTLVFFNPLNRGNFDKFAVQEFSDGELSGKNFDKIEQFIDKNLNVQPSVEHQNIPEDLRIKVMSPQEFQKHLKQPESWYLVEVTKDQYSTMEAFQTIKDEYR